jgi:Ca2+-binding RTX toxin-like protein
LVAISRNAGSYALIAAASLKPNAEALSKLAQAAGNSVSTIRTTLTTQKQDVTRFVEKVSTEADAAASLETARGLTRSADTSAAVADALKSVQQRFAYTESRNSTRPSNTNATSPGAALVAMLSESLQDDGEGFNFSMLIPRTSSKQQKPNQISISAARQDQADIFDRSVPLTTAVGGTATTSVTKTALTAQVVDVLIDKNNPSLGSLPSVSYVADGAPRSGNEGFLIRTVTGSGDDTVVLDTRDQTAEDTRLSLIDLSTGDGSDVIFIAGNNASKIDAGAGDDFVAVEGDAIVDGGDGNDLIYARTASGDAGDDIIFSDGFASGGDGNDTITLFSLDTEQDTAAKLAFGGAGDDQIVASVQANIDGGEGDDVLLLRDGGLAVGGDGNDTLSAWATATLEGGAGDDDLYLLAGGSVDAGEGDDKVESGRYASVTGGAGDDTITMNGGGVFTFRKGDGADQVDMQKTLFDLDDKDKTRVNRIILDGFDYSDITATIDALKMEFKPVAASTTGDKLTIDREVLGKTEIVFRKNGFDQVLKVDGLTQTLGPRMLTLPGA